MDRIEIADIQERAISDLVLNITSAFARNDIELVLPAENQSGVPDFMALSYQGFGAWTVSHVTVTAVDTANERGWQGNMTNYGMTGFSPAWKQTLCVSLGSGTYEEALDFYRVPIHETTLTAVDRVRLFGLLSTMSVLGDALSSPIPDELVRVATPESEMEDTRPEPPTAQSSQRTLGGWLANGARRGPEE